MKTVTTTLGNQPRHGTLRQRATVQGLAATFGRILAILIALLLCMPVILLPFTTSVPAWGWILLAILWM